MTEIVSLILQYPRDATAIAAVLAFFWTLHLLRQRIVTDLEEMKVSQKEILKAVQDLRVEQVRLSESHGSHEDIVEVRAAVQEIRQRVMRLEGAHLGI